MISVSVYIQIGITSRKTHSYVALYTQIIIQIDSFDIYNYMTLRSPKMSNIPIGVSSNSSSIVKVINKKLNLVQDVVYTTKDGSRNRSHVSGRQRDSP